MTVSFNARPTESVTYQQMCRQRMESTRLHVSRRRCLNDLSTISYMISWLELKSQLYWAWFHQKTVLKFMLKRSLINVMIKALWIRTLKCSLIHVHTTKIVQLIENQWHWRLQSSLMISIKIIAHGY